MISTTQPVQMWDGERFHYVTEAEAAKMEKAGTAERSAGMDANKLKPRGYFTAAQKPAKGRKRKRHTYKTTHMEAE